MVSISTGVGELSRGIISKPLMRFDHAQEIVSIVSIGQGNAKEIEENLTKPLVKSSVQCNGQF